MKILKTFTLATALALIGSIGGFTRDAMAIDSMAMDASRPGEAQGFSWGAGPHVMPTDQMPTDQKVRGNLGSLNSLGSVNQLFGAGNNALLPAVQNQGAGPHVMPGDTKGLNFSGPGDEKGQNFSGPGDEKGLNFANPGAARGLNFTAPSDPSRGGPNFTNPALNKSLNFTR